MKKYFLVLTLLLTSLPFAKGQKFTINGGLVMSNVGFFVDGATIETNTNFGFFTGIDGEFKLVENLYQGIGIEFIQKGFKIKSPGNEVNFGINYINFPLNARYKFDLVDFKLTFEAGAFFGIAMSGERTSNEISERLKFGKDEGQFAYADFGFNLGYTIETDLLKLRLAYNVGLNDIASSQLEEMKNRSFTFGIGIIF